ncbi:hypothetical protein [Micromonospora sonneratiae]|uniref:4-amino-4-deoxy-L-arabinose transferase n=1 Tax=Micromonospora sonneratiae TaxID=1184706 RepID=A0ABW3YN28_9ACTN
MRRSRVVAMTTGSAAVLGAVLLVLPRMGSDLSAQVARAEFFAAHGYRAIDLRWYGGVNQFGYSLVSQPLMAALGVRVTGVLALLVAATAFAALLARTKVARPLLGSLVGVVCIAGNLVSGRVTYALGVAFGLVALLALTVPGDSGRRRLVRYGGAVVGTALASAASPVAGLFVGLAGAALLLTRRYAPGLALGVPAAGPMLLTGVLFGEGGWMNISRTDTVHAVVTSLVVAVLVNHRAVRFGALLSALGVLLAALVQTPVGLNATRLVVMFALPLLAADARPPAWLTEQLPARLSRRLPTMLRGRTAQVTALTVLLAAVFWWQPPVVAADLRSAGDPTGDRAYFTPLVAELRQRNLTGRVEIPPTRNYWEAAHLDELPLARGWLRQVDIDRNPLFFTTVPGAAGTGVPLTESTYRDWLHDNAVQYVAVPDAELSWIGRAEAQLVGDGLPYLSLVWTDPHWRLYAVTDPQPIVAAPASVAHQDAATLTFDTPVAGQVRVRIRYSPWLTVSDGATLTAEDGWTLVTTPQPGRYTVSS